MLFDQLKRREVITLLGGAAAAWPLTTRAQQPAIPVVGFLRNTSPDEAARFVAAFSQGLGEAGYVEGRNVSIEYRWTGGQTDRLPAMAADLVARRVNVIVALGSTPAIRAAKAATTTIPIVFMLGTDPVELGIVASLNRPEGNLTGVVNLNHQLAQKWLDVLHPLVPATTYALLVDPANAAGTSLYIREMQAAARTHGTDLADTYRLAGVYTGRILKGEKPSDLPVQQATKVELVINLKTAKALGLEVPPTVLARADEVIE